MANTVFLLHGMGLHPADWAANFKKKLAKVYANPEYKRMNAKAFGERFTLVELEYDSVFRGILGRWSQDAAQLLQAKPAKNIPNADSMLQWLTDASKGDDNFAWTHAADVFMYRFFGSVRAQVKVHVAKQITATLDELDGEPWSIIAHSLGTAVAHDTLHALWSDNGGADPDDPRVPSGYGAAQYPAQAVVMVANVSRVLETNPDVRGPHTTVRPGPLGSAKHGCAQYLNIRHKFDPITWVKPFEPDRWPEPDSDYMHIRPTHIWNYNVHDLEHYFENPCVNAEVFRAIAFDGIITKKEQEAAQEAFKPYKFKSVDEATISKVRGELEALRPAGDAEWDELLKLWDRFRVLIDKEIP